MHPKRLRDQAVALCSVPRRSGASAVNWLTAGTGRCHLLGDRVGAVDDGPLGGGCLVDSSGGVPAVKGRRTRPEASGSGASRSPAVVVSIRGREPLRWAVRASGARADRRVSSASIRAW